jgi:transposase-like protein
MAKRDRSISKEQQVSLAMELYLSGGHTQKAIADMVGISENTMKSWIDKNDWEVLRGAKESSRGQILAKLYRKVNNMTDNEKFNEDALLKVVKAIEFFSPNRISASGKLETMKGFLNYLWETDSDLAKAIVPHVEIYRNIFIKDALASK